MSIDPVGARAIEALSRRAETHDEEVNAVIEARLRVLRERYDSALAPALGRTAVPAPRDSSLAGLVALLARKVPEKAEPIAASVPPPLKTLLGDRSTPALPALERARRTWSRLSMDRRISQSLARRPENAGPLNSHQLVHRTLALLHAVSPTYLEVLVAQLDDLAWLEDALTEAPKPRAAPRRDRPAGPRT